jgi:endonuclease YncB( thermonuclease family)
VLLPDGTNVNHTLVKDGWCWWYRKYAPENVILEELERRARASGLGLWADPASGAAVGVAMNQRSFDGTIFGGRSRR